jgi:iron complex outermembrane receptor protein
LVSYELGYKSSWLNNRLVFNASAYYYDYKNMQLTVNRVIDGTFVSVLANAGKGEVKGIEFEARALLTQNLTLRGNLSSLHTKFKELVTGTTSYAGYNFARVPNVTGLIGLDYAVLLGSGRLRLATDWSYQSKTNFNVTNNTDPYALQERYWLGTLRASYAFAGDKTVVSAFVNNVADKDYKIQAMLYANSRYNTRLGDPRTVGVSVTTRF